jgi:hypothetical protein
LRETGSQPEKPRTAHREPVQPDRLPEHYQQEKRPMPTIEILTFLSVFALVGLPGVIAIIDLIANALNSQPVETVTLETPKTCKEITIINGFYYFYDETWSHIHGPYDTFRECQEALGKYCDYLDGHNAAMKEINHAQ